MPITLQGITLPADLQWTDEFTGHGVGQIITPTLTGALLVEETNQTKGRQITLQSNGAAWTTRATVEALAALVGAPLAAGATIPFVWADGREFDVVFDRSRGPGFRAVEVQRLAASAQATTHPYTIEINLLTA